MLVNQRRIAILAAMSEERRISRDGGEYTLREFITWYGDMWGLQRWQEARIAGARHTGVMASETPEPTAEAAQSTAIVGACQPGGSPWQGCVFLTQTLQQNQKTLRRERPQLLMASTPREAIDRAYELQDYLPLPVEAFACLCPQAIIPALGAIGGARQPAWSSVEAVVAERIPRIPDINRQLSCRVDFFLYCRNGDIIRHHPGRAEQNSMHPHRMPSGSVLFSLAQAQEIGVGASLHLRPPGRAVDAGAPQPGVVLCSRGDVDESCSYDMQMWSWRRVRETLLWNCRRGEQNGQLDVSDGHLIPWWLLLASTDHQRHLLDRGVTHVVASGCTLVVTLLDGGRMILCD